MIQGYSRRSAAAVKGFLVYLARDPVTVPDDTHPGDPNPNDMTKQGQTEFPRLFAAASVPEPTRGL